jgi:hypothetical protein
MPDTKVDQPLPNGYVRLPGSERRFASKAKAVGAVDGKEKFSVTIVLRRRADGPPMPDFDYFTKTPPRKRDRLAEAAFTARYGAHPDDIRAVEKFAAEYGLQVTKAHAGRRHVVLSGTAAQFSKAFAVSLSHFEIAGRKSLRSMPVTPTRRYRDHEGFVHVPENLAAVIVGVFGLDSAPVGSRGNYAGDPPIINRVTVKQVTQLYNFPTPGATIGGQTIGVITTAGANGGGYLQSDLDLTFSNVGLTAPKVIPISVEPGVGNAAYTAPTTAVGNVGDATLTFANTANINGGLLASYTYAGVTHMIQLVPASATTAEVYTYVPAAQPAGQDFVPGSWSTGLITTVPKGTVVSINLDGETNQDIAISALAAAGANVVDYFTDDTQQGWVDLIGRVLMPEAGDFPAGVNPPTVLTSSWVIAIGDDTNGLAEDLGGNVTTTATLLAMTASFQDAAVLQNGPTICVCSMDYGSFSQITDGYAHVSYPSSDPWILSCGGTTLGQYQAPGSSTIQHVEYAWNDPTPGETWGASGGGVSAFFPVPSYQDYANVGNTVNIGVAGSPAQTVPTTGRGVPDVAANASLNSGYAGLYMGGGLIGYPGNGTSAAAPLWAGLIAVLNANAGFNLGFANPSFYTFPASDFCPITPLWRDPANPALADCPVDNSDGGAPGYKTRAGWDAVTGLGSPNGMNLLASIQELEQVYIMGGYQSPDIILTDLSNNQAIPIGGLPGGRWDTLLAPSTDYGFSANVHNDSSTTAGNVVVSFWAIPGGVGTNGSMVGTPQTVSIAAHSTLNVKASAHFTSAPEGDHLCAVVSLYNPSTGCSVDAMTALEIPNPGYSDTHQCSAWRNTDSMFGVMGSGFRFGVGLGNLPFRFEEPIILKLTTTHIPATVLRDPVINDLQNTLRALGATPNLPVYLLPGFEREFAAVDLKPKLSPTKGLRLEERLPGEWHLFPHGEDRAAALEIQGEVPASAKAGDVMLVNVTAQYPAFERHAARQVGFLEFVHVVEKLPRR